MKTRPLLGKTALVTGASRGIGRAISLRLAADGAAVAVCYGHDRAAAGAVVERIRQSGGAAFSVRANLGEQGDALNLWEEFDRAAKESLGDNRVDIIVNNAGIGRSSDITSLTEPEFDRLFAVNVRAPFFVVQLALPRMQAGGRIINISSLAARVAMTDIMAYSATKAALDNFTLNLAKELGHKGITVNSVAPGIIDTELNATWLDGNPTAQADAASRAALGRIGQPEDIADVVAFIASDDARWVTGRVIDVSGGSGL